MRKNNTNIILNNKGITLVAMVITVIVLLILAGVTIAMLTGDNGIITKANIAKISTDFAGYKEELESWKTAKKMEDTNFSEDTLFAGKNNLSYNSNKREGNIKNIIPDFKDSYLDELEIIKGELTLNTLDKSKIRSAKIANISTNQYEIKDGELMSAGSNLDLLSSDGTITIPENVTKIGQGAFSGLTGLKTVIIPGTVKEIGEDAFSNNATLEKVIIQDGVQIIGKFAFTSCKNLKKVEMTDSIIEIQSSAFGDDIRLKEINLSNNIKKIQSASFSNCMNLSKINIPQNVTSIEDLAFAGCQNLDDLYIHKNLNTISSGAFRGCTNLNIITIDKENKNFVLENDILYNVSENQKYLTISLASNLSKKDITIAEGVTNLDVGALGYFPNIETLSLPSTLSSMNGWTFENVGNELKNINIPESNSKFKVIDNMILSKDGTKFIMASINRENLVIPDSVKIVTSASIRGPYIKKVVINDNVEQIQSQVFRYVKNIEEISMGKNINSLDSAFRYQSKLCKATLTIDSNNPNYMVDGNLILTKDRKNLITVVNNVSDLVVPEGIEIIENLENIDLEKIKLPNTIKEIKDIKSNFKLQEIEIPQSCEKISENAFVRCDNLEKIKINKSENAISGAPWGVPKGARIVSWN